MKEHVALERAERSLGEAGAVPMAQDETVDGFEQPLVENRAADELPPKVDRRFVTAALMLVMVLASMEMTVTSTAMPTIIGQLHGLEHYSWVASLYLLCCTITMPLYGRLADVLGRKKVILGAILIFAAGSTLASLAQSMPQLIICRGLQGLGAGGIMPVVLTILGDIFTLEERARIQGLFSATWGMSSLAGPALGAFLVHTLGWRWVFLVNLPFGLLGVGVLLWKYHDHRKPHSTNLDLPGIALLSVTSLTLLALVSGSWELPITISLAVVMIGCAIAFVFQEKRSSNPVLPPSFVIRRDIGPSIAATFFFGGVFLCLDTFVPLYVQGGRPGGTAAAAAGVVTPVMLTWAASNMLSAPLIVRWGFRKTALVGAILLMFGIAGLVLGAYYVWSRTALTAVLAMTGFGFGWSSMSYLLSAQSAVEWHQRGIATSSVSFFRTMGGAVGVGLMGTAFNLLARHDLNQLRAMGFAPAAALDPHLQTSLPPAAMDLIHHAISSSLLWVFVAMFCSAVIMLIITTQMRDSGKGVKIDKEAMREAAAH